MGESTTLLKMRGITKQFPGVLAVDHVDLEVHVGEVLTLVGENGAGKSTLMKILSGAYTPDEGEIFLDGKCLQIKTPTDAIEQGITIIYQELNTCETLSIAENIFVGNLPTKGKVFKTVDRKEADRRTAELLQQLNLHYEPRTPVSKLSIAEKQIIEIAKALSRNTRILVMDEPTAALNDKEVHMLFDIVHRVKALGTGIIFISHRLDEVLEIADRIQIMRDGKSVFVGETCSIDKAGIIHHMVGRDIVEGRIRQTPALGEVVFEAEGLTTSIAKDINFNARAGEIVGLFGLMGCGRTNIAKAIFGAVPLTGGTIKIDGKAVCIKSPADAKRAGISYIPNDRKLEGLMLNQSIKQNICITVLDKVMGRVQIRKKREIEIAHTWVKRINIKTTNINKEVNSLSGGNQQKVVMGKWLATAPKVMILNEPTRGVDVGAKREIYNLILDLCNEGMAVIMISSDLPEVLSLADRVVVIHEGRYAGEILGNDLTQHNLMTKAVGEEL